MVKPPEQSASVPLLPLIAARMLINGSYRMIYPFLPAFAAGLGMPLAVVAIPLTVRSVVGAFGPLFAPLSERHGRKRGMILGLSILLLGAGCVAISPSYLTFFIALVAASLANQIFLPAMQAYIGDRIPYTRRGRALALTEMAWSLSFILLVPLAGLMIARLGWSAPFLVFGVLAAAATGWLAWRIPGDRGEGSPATGMLWHGVKLVAASPAAWLALAFGLSITLANEIVNAVFGVWLSETFGLEIAALGLAAGVIGIAELGGESTTAALVDRIGKKRSVRIGLLITSIAALALPLFGRGVMGALVGLFLFYFGFELALVSFIPLVTEVLPEARASMMAVNLAAFSLGRALGVQTGLWLHNYSFTANAIAALALNAVALYLLHRITAND